MTTPTDVLCPVCGALPGERCVRVADPHHPRHLEASPGGQVHRERKLAAPAPKVLEEIARKHTGFQCLDEKNNDGCDFREVSVWGIRAALEAAYEAGASAAREKHDHALACLGTLLLALEHERAQNGEPVARPSEGWMREARIALDKARAK